MFLLLSNLVHIRKNHHEKRLAVVRDTYTLEFCVNKYISECLVLLRFMLRITTFKKVNIGLLYILSPHNIVLFSF